MIKNILILSLLCSYLGNANAQWGQAIYIDDSSKDSTLQLFLAELETAVENQDSTFLRASLSEVCYTPFEGGEQVDADRFWKYYSNGKDLQLWSNLRDIFRIGGGKLESEADHPVYTMPFTALGLQDYSLDDIMGKDLYVVLGDSIPIYSYSYEDGQVVDTVEVMASYHIVQRGLAGGHGAPEMALIWDPGRYFVDQQFWIQFKYVARISTLRCGLIKESAGWKIQYVDFFE